MGMRSSMLRSLSVSFALLAVALAAPGCSEPNKAEQAPAASASVTSTTPPSNGAIDAGVAAAAKDAGKPEYNGPYIGALFMQTPVLSDMEWPKDEDKRKPGDKSGSVRLGYLRQGAKVPVIAEPHVKSNCKEGWYELVQGGFVCGKYASIEDAAKNPARAPRLKRYLDARGERILKAVRDVAARHDAKPAQVGDGIPSFEPRTPIVFHGLTATTVEGWNQRGRLFSRGPGTAPPVHVGITVIGDEKQVTETLRRNGIPVSPYAEGKPFLYVTSADYFAPGLSAKYRDRKLSSVICTVN